jgi:hypothetical protein
VALPSSWRASACAKPSGSRPFLPDGLLSGAQSWCTGAWSSERGKNHFWPGCRLSWMACKVVWHTWAARKCLVFENDFSIPSSSAFLLCAPSCAYSWIIHLRLSQVHVTCLALDHPSSMPVALVDLAKIHSAVAQEAISGCGALRCQRLCLQKPTTKMNFD